jgi:hypothetical protein
MKIPWEGNSVAIPQGATIHAKLDVDQGGSTGIPRRLF